jgi:NitT/TauT family transport system permease protein
MPSQGTDTLERELAGLDALELALPKRRSAMRRRWDALWPPVAAFALVIFGWQLLVWSGWKPEYILPSPFTVAQAFKDDFSTILTASINTLRRGIEGFAFSVLIGTIIGLAAARFRVVRAAIGSLITGLQTMPSVAWTPIALVLFKQTEAAIFFVVVLGAAPAVANGLLGAIDHIPPILLRAGRVLGARGFASLRYVVIPAALPTFVSGLKQAWAFAWRALMGAELLIFVAGQTTLGQQLDLNRSLSDYPAMYADMVAVLVIGIVVDILVFGKLETALRRKYGLVDAAD